MIRVFVCFTNINIIYLFSQQMCQKRTFCHMQRILRQLKLHFRFSCACMANPYILNEQIQLVYPIRCRSKGQTTHGVRQESVGHVDPHEILISNQLYICHIWDMWTHMKHSYICCMLWDSHDSSRSNCLVLVHVGLDIQYVIQVCVYYVWDIWTHM